MRILHIALGGCLKGPPIDYGLTEDTGGHIAYVLGGALAQARREEVKSVDIVTRAFLDPNLCEIYDQLEEWIAPKVRILRLRTRNRNYLSKDDLAAEIPALETELCHLLNTLSYRPDVIHAHFADAAQLARIAHDRFTIPWIYTPHSLGLEKQDCDPSSRRIAGETTAIRTAHALIVSSRDEAERQLMAYDVEAAGRTHRISPGVTLPAREGERKGRDLVAPFLRDLSKPMVLAVARPVRKKNLAALVEAFAQVPELRERANLVILAGLRKSVAEGPEEQVSVCQELIQLIDRHDLWGQVAIPRRHSAADLRSLYDIAARSGVFANPAAHEPFGLTLVEAAQAGVPLVATSNGGPSSIISDIGYGALVDPKDAQGLGHTILDLLSDPKREAGRRAAQKRARRLYQWNSWARESLAVCRDISRHRMMEKRRVSCLLACDLDGTLTGDKLAAAEFTQWTAQRKDTCMLVATGRSISEARRVISHWSLPCPDTLVTSVGTEIWRCEGMGNYRICRDYAAVIDSGWNRAAIVGALGSLLLRSQPLHDQRQWKLSYFGNAQDVTQIKRALADSGLQARVVFSHGELIDILPRAAGKAAAIAFEAERLKLSLQDCIAAGDSGNDLDMLTACGAAILPANARDGIAEVLRGKAYISHLNHAAGVLDGLSAILGEARSRVVDHA